MASEPAPPVSSDTLAGTTLQGPLLQGARLYGTSSNHALKGHRLIGLQIAGAELERSRLAGVEEGPWLESEARLSDGRVIPLLVRIVAHTTDPDLGSETENLFERPEYDPAVDDPSGDVHLYDLEYYDESRGARPMCPRATDGSGRAAVLLAGTWGNDRGPAGELLDTGHYRPSADELTVACTAGVLAKCARWGYKPWAKARDEQGVWRELGPIHRACARAARADFCGTGSTHTLPGQTIDIFDVHSFIAPSAEADAPVIPESTFDATGAGCVRDEVWSRLGAHTCAGRTPDVFTDQDERSTCMAEQLKAGAPQLVLINAQRCQHAPEIAGAALLDSCSACADAVCDLDPHCCNEHWDAACVATATEICTP